MGMISNKLKTMAATGLVLAAASLAQAEEVGIAPYLHPRPCDYVLETKGFDILRSKNCEKVFLTPKTIEKPFNKIDLEGSVDLCTGHSKLIETVNKRISNYDRALDKLDEAMDANDMDSIDYWEQKADSYSEKVQEAQKSYAKYASIHAGTVRSVFRNEVNGDDVADFTSQNMGVFLTMSKAGLKIPDVEPVRVKNSLYSFVHHRPEVATEDLKTIISTTVPGLEILEQPTAKQTNVAHVKANGVVQGETKISLASVCPMVEKQEGSWTVQPKKIRDFMTVKRSYTVPMKASYTITATMDTEIASDVLARMIVQTHNHGLSKTQFYEKLTEITGKEVFSITYDEDGSFDGVERQLVVEDIRKKLVDRFLQIYESREQLATLTPVKLDPPTGGTVDVVKTARRCWSSSSWFGLKKSGGCYDYNYTVPTWYEGKNHNEIHDLLRIDLELREDITENKIYEYPMDTVFFDLDDLSEKELDEKEIEDEDVAQL